MTSPDEITPLRPSTPTSSIRYLGLAFVAFFLVAFMVVLFVVRGAWREAREVLSEDLEGTVRKYNRPSVPTPMVGPPPRRANGGTEQLEIEQ